MGMSIDEHKKHLLDIMDSMPDDACGDWRDSLAYAIDTLQKYQKIEQILQADFEEYHPFDRDHYKLYLIKKELENGKDD